MLAKWAVKDWQKAREVSLQNAAGETMLVECSNCGVPECSDSNVLSSASAGENEASELWMNNGAYSLSHNDKSIILSTRGWLTDNIISAAQMLLLQSFPGISRLKPPAELSFWVSSMVSGEVVQNVHVRGSHWCVVSTMGCETCVVRVYDHRYYSIYGTTVCTRICQMICSS